MASNATILENKIKDKLGIRWVDARAFSQKAQEKLGIGNDELEEHEDEMMLESLKAFVALSSEEKETMRRKKAEAAEEPEWKRKAREQAERREREWEERAAAEKLAQSESSKPADTATDTVLNNSSAEPTITKITQGPEQQINGPKKVVRVTKTVTHSNGDTKTIETTKHDPLQGPSVKITHTKVCCVVM